MASLTSSPIKTKGPPPPVPKKPAYLKDLPVPPKNLPTPPKDLPPPPKDLAVPPKIIDKLNSSLRDELNRKLSTHLTLPVPGKDLSRNLNLPKTPPKPTNQNKVNLKDELQSVFAKRNDSSFKDDRFNTSTQQYAVDSSLSNPKVEQISSFTHVTKIIENPKETSDLDNTLDISLTDNPFDATQSHGDDLIAPHTNYNDDNTDEFLEDLPMVLPPPDMSLFDDSSEISQSKGEHDEGIPSPDLSTSEEAYDVDVIIPPPPPPDPLLYDSDEESYSCGFEPIPEFLDDSDDDDVRLDIDKTLVESETYTVSDDPKKEVLPDPPVISDKPVVPATCSDEIPEQKPSKESLPSTNLTCESDNLKENFEKLNDLNNITGKPDTLKSDFNQLDSSNNVVIQSETPKKDSNQSNHSDEEVISIPISQRRLSFEINNKDVQSQLSSINKDTINNKQSDVSSEIMNIPIAQRRLSFENNIKDLKSQLNLSNKDTMRDSSVFQTQTSYIDTDVGSGRSTPIKSPIKSPPITPSITPLIKSNPNLANNINHILKRQLVNPGTPMKLSEFKKSISYDSDNNNNYSNFNKGPVMTSGRSTPGPEIDSGFSTARSVDGSISDRNHSKSNKLEESLFTAFPAADTQMSAEDKSPISNRVSQTFSSSSESSSLSDDDEVPQKMNLRNLLLKHMKNTESDSDSDDDLGLEKKNDKNGGMGDLDENNHYGTDTETRLNEVDVVDWRVEDVCEWLELIGFSYLRGAFAKKMVTGKMLINPDLKILDQIRFDQPEDREIIQSEISALQMTNDEEMEMAILDALDKAYTQERDEIYATMNGNIQRVGSGRNSKISKIPLRTPNHTLDETNSRDVSADYRIEGDTNSMTSKEDLKKKLGADVYDPDDDDGKGNEVADSNEQLKVKKKSKKKGFFSSLRKKGSKRDQSAITEDQMQAIVQSNPKGMVSISYTPTNGSDTEIKLLISMNTTAREVCNLCLDYLGMNEDLLCFYLVVIKKNKKGQSMDLNPADPPLMFQCKWSDDEKHRFELRYKYDGQIVVNSENTEQQEMVTCRLSISAQSTPKDIIPVLLKVFKEKEEKKYFSLVQGEKETRIADNSVLLDLPLCGQKCHVFKLLNTSPSYLNRRKNDSKKVDTKVSLLEMQVDKLTTLNEEYRRSEEQLSKENEKLNMEVKKQEDEVMHKNNDVKILQDQISTLTQKLRLSTSSPLNEPLREETEKLKQKITEQQYSIMTLEQGMKTIKETKANLEKELDETRNKCQKMESSNEELKEKLEQIKEEKRNKVADNTEQMNKLYAENKEYLKCMRNLEDKLAEAEQKVAELQLGHDVENSDELRELRNRIDSLDSSMLAKDTRILEFEYKMQQKDRDLKDMRDQWEDECRKSRKEIELKETAESRCEDLVIKMDNLKLAMNEKDTQLQTFKTQNTKLEKKLNKQKYLAENERNVKAHETHEINKRHQEELNVLLEKVQTADKLLAENDIAIKQLAFDLTKEKEDLMQANADLEKKLSAKDIILDRLESKIAKADLNLSTKLQEQEEMLRTKEEKIQRVELEMARLENEHASKIREMATTIRTKEALITKMESRFRKLEMSSGDNVKKFEKYVSEKDRLLLQVTSDHEKTSKDLKLRVRELEDTLNEKEKKLREAMRQYGEIKTTTDARLKKREKEYKRQKFLLEKVLKLVSDKAPSLLRQLHESLDGDNASIDNMKSSANSPREGVINDEWC